MKFSLETSSNANLIHTYDNDFIIIKTRNSELVTVNGSLILTSNHIVTDYEINPITHFSIGDINYLKNLDPEVVILTHGSSVRLSPQLIVEFSEQAMGVEMMSLGSACRTYNLLVAEGRRVVLVINFEQREQ